MIEQTLNNTTLKEAAEFDLIDIHFADFIINLEDTGSVELHLAAAVVSAETRSGNTCADLEALAGTELKDHDGNHLIVFPGLTSWVNILKKCDSVGAPGDFKPLILDGKNRLYLYRYWEYEHKLAELIKIRTIDLIEPGDIDKMRDSLAGMSSVSDHGEFDYQKLAAFIALTKRFCVITGGPGTGKTSTVVKIMTMLLEQDKNLKIALATPTGKAAARLQESIAVSLPGLKCDEQIKALIPTNTSTIHRLLGTKTFSPYFRYNHHNRLPYDVVIVDEVSMVDLALMSKLIQALKDEARLILIGDKDQLASVESGAVLGDICASLYEFNYSPSVIQKYEAVAGEQIPTTNAKNTESPMRDCIVELKHSYRFGKTSGIGVISDLINKGKTDDAAQALKSGSYQDIEWSPLPGRNEIAAAISKLALENYSDFLKAEDPHTALELFGRFQVLCAINEGPFGIVNLNYLIERILYNSGLIDLRQTWYGGRPIIITRNDYRLDLYNGDIGIVYPDDENPAEMKAHFIAADGSLRKISPVRLPAHETVYAMTVHKSQGSEFDEVLLILPEKDNPVLTRELIYTGLTRARKKIKIWAPEQIFKTAVNMKVSRQSGLADLLWK